MGDPEGPGCDRKSNFGHKPSPNGGVFVVASARVSSWASADRLAPRQPSRPISSAALVSSLNQRLIGKASAGDRTDKAFY
jgi:hypothetical protein